MQIRSTMGVAGILAVAGVASAQVERLETLGGTNSLAWGINDLGQIVGDSQLTGDTATHATIWTDLVASDLGTLGAGHNSYAEAINIHGDVVGYDDDPSSGIRTALLIESGSAPFDLGAAIGAFGPSNANDIADSGLVVGQAAITPGFAKGFLWDSVGGGQQIGTIPFYDGGGNYGVNESGTIVGRSFFFGDPDDATVAVDTGSGYEAFQVGPFGYGYAIATDINESNLVVGHTHSAGPGEFNAVIYTQDPKSPFIPLGTLPGKDISAADAVNDLGVIVGAAWDGQYSLTNTRAWVYLNDEMIDLNDFLPHPSDFRALLRATDINNRNDIVGIGQLKNGDLAGFVMYGVGLPEACSEADLTTQGASAGDPLYGVPDGGITAADLQYFIGAWVAGNLTVADVTTAGASAGDPGYGVPDGVTSAADIQYFVQRWIEGCP